MLTGAYDTDEKRVYYRVLKSIDVSDESQLSKVMVMLGDAVLKGLAVRVQLGAPPIIDTCAYFFHRRAKEYAAMPFCLTQHNRMAPSH